MPVHWTPFRVPCSIVSRRESKVASCARLSTNHNSSEVANDETGVKRRSWVVRNYDVNIDEFAFFFVMAEAGPESLRNGSASDITSGWFQIVENPKDEEGDEEEASSTSAELTEAPTLTCPLHPVISLSSVTRTAREATTSSTTAEVSSPSPDEIETTDPDASTGLSYGARVGIGIGAAVGGIAILALLFFLGKHIRTKRKSLFIPGELDDGGLPEVASTYRFPPAFPPVELSSRRESYGPVEMAVEERFPDTSPQVR